MKTTHKLRIAGGSLYWLLFLPWAANGPLSEQQQNSAKQDLIIQKVILQQYPNDPYRPGKPGAHLTVTVLNKSKETTYHHIEIESYFLNKQGVIIDGGSHRIVSRIAPGQSRTEDNIPVGTIKPEVVSARLEIKSAQTD